MTSELPGDVDLMRLQIRTLFQVSVMGRLVAPSPRVFVGRAGGERLVRVRSDIHESTCRTWLRCAADDELREAVETHAEVTAEYRGPAYVLPLLSPREDAVPVSPSTPLHPELVARGWHALEQPPYIGVVRDGLVVACCFSSRSTPEAAEAGVETAESYRGRGLARVAVAGWAAAVQASGRLALYSTTWGNDASQHVASALGAHEYGEDWHLT